MEMKIKDDFKNWARDPNGGGLTPMLQIVLWLLCFPDIGWLVMKGIYYWAKSNKKSSISPDNSIYDCEIE